MRRYLFASTFTALALSIAAVSAQAAPMSTSDLLKPTSGVTDVAAKCYNKCSYYGYCGYGYKKYKCCKTWTKVCH